MSEARASVVAALIAASVFAGCGSDPSTAVAETAPRGPVTVDEREGTYRGVGIGSTRAEAKRAFGRSTSRSTDPLSPIGVDPSDIGVPPSPQDPGEGIQIWRFKRAAIAAGRGRAWLLTIAADDALTSERVGIGSRLADVRAAYPRMKCGTANERTEYPQFKYCTKRVAPKRYLYFGHDPVRSLTLSTEPLV